MASKIPKKLQAKWEAILAADGLAPIDGPFSAGAREHRDLVSHVAATSEEEMEHTRAYYRRAEKFRDRMVMAHAIWSLHCEGLGRRNIGQRLGLSEKVVRLVLTKLQVISGL